MTINTDHTSDTLTPSGGTLVISGAASATNIPATGTILSSVTAPATNPATGTPSASTYLRGDGTWASPTGSGSVTSVDVSGGTTGLTTSGGPITGSGTITLNGTLGLAHGGTGKTTAPAAMANLMGFTTTATAGGTTVLTNTSSYYQVFTGSTTQTITLPDVTTLAQGWSFHLVNNSTGNLTVNSSGGNLVFTVIPQTTVMVTCILTTGTTAASWEAGVTDFGGTSGTGNVVMTTQPTVTGLALSAGTTTVAPLDFAAGTNLTTASAGAMEYDGSAFYSSVANSTRGVMPSEQIVVLNTAYTLTSQTAAQKLFNASTNGAVTLPVGTYQFECFYSLTSMSATSGTFGFALGGTATKTQSWTAAASKPTSFTAASNIIVTYNTAANAVLVTANTNTVAHATIKGIIQVTVAGTIIPQVSLGVAAAAVVGANSYFKISPISGTSAANITVGNWS